MIKWNSRYNWALHIMFWTTTVFFLSYFFGHFSRQYLHTFLYVCFQLPVIITTTYLINYWLVPKFLFQDRTGRFVYMLIACLVVSAWLNALITIFAFTILYHFNAGNLPPASFDFKMLTAGLYLVIILGVAIHFARESLKQQRTAFELSKKQIETELSLNETRLKLLQNQLHPHMLFNSLNTIYGLSLQQSPGTSGLVLNLSNMLDYMLYQCNTEKIILKNEIEFLENYIEIEKQRFPEGLSLEIDWPDKDEEYEIAPLLLLPIVENCFKHTRNLQDIHPEIRIKASLEKGRFHLHTSNNCRKNEKPGRSTGIGLNNLNERLVLLYPGKHEMSSRIENSMYIVDLALELDARNREKLS
jgi:sensor histidine kinase YesM